MEAGLDFYAQPADPTNPRLCFDERPCQLLADVIAPLPAQPKHPRRENSEYKRNGTAVVLLAYDLDTGQRYVQVRQRRTKRGLCRIYGPATLLSLSSCSTDSCAAR
jgi:hypothetical protein